MADQKHLRSTLLDLDSRGYKAYLDIKGSYQFPDFTLIVDHVQGDPFASPSKLRVKVPQSVAGFPQELYQSRTRSIALRDYLTREFNTAAKEISSFRGTGKSGLISIANTGQEVLERTATVFNDNYLEVRFLVGLPARGRRILGRQAAQMLVVDIPNIVDSALKYPNLNSKKVKKHVETVEDAHWLRQQLPEKGLVAFIANDSIPPRSSGVDPTPLMKDAVPFQAPPSMSVEFNCPNGGLNY